MPNGKSGADKFTPDKSEAKQYTNQGDGATGGTAFDVEPLDQQVCHSDDTADHVQHEVPA